MRVGLASVRPVCRRSVRLLVERVPYALVEAHGGSLRSKLGESIGTEYPLEFADRIVVFGQLVRDASRPEVLQGGIGCTYQSCGAVVGTEPEFGDGQLAHRPGRKHSQPERPAHSQ